MRLNFKIFLVMFCALIPRLCEGSYGWDMDLIKHKQINDAISEIHAANAHANAQNTKAVAEAPISPAQATGEIIGAIVIIIFVVCIYLGIRSCIS